MVAAQQADPDTLAILAKLSDPGSAPSCEYRTLYVVSDGVLGVREADGRLRIMVPPGPLRTEICRYFHDEAGHQGVQRTLQAVTRYFYWPGMSRFVTQYVSSCAVCQAGKSSNRLTAGFSESHLIPAEPAAEWSLDFLELPTSANGFHCLLVCTERVSKLVVLVPMSNSAAALTAADVAKAFVNEVICWFGVPLVIFTDRGPQFRSAIWHDIWTLMGSSVKHSTPHTPHSHGDVERQNRVINDMLRTMLDNFPDVLPRWDEYVKLIQFTLNNAMVTRTGMSPLFFFFGRHPRVPASLHFPQSALDPMSLEFVTSFQNRLQTALDKGRESQIRLIKSMDTRRDQSIRFQVGNEAWLRSNHCPIPGNKHFRLPWTGPFRITAVTPSTATLDLPEHWRLLSHTFHFDKLSPYRVRPPEIGPTAVPPPPVLLQDGTLWYEVDRVVAHAWRGRKRPDGRRTLHYWVRFKGYSDAYNLSRPCSLLLEQGAQGHLLRYHRAFNVPLPPELAGVVAPALPDHGGEGGAGRGGAGWGGVGGGV